MKKLFPLILSCVALVLIPVATLAAEQVEIGKFGQWTANEFDENGAKVCYMTATPTDKSPVGARRGDVVVFITHRPSEGTRNVFTYMSGYPYKKDKDVIVTVDGKKFNLFTQNDMAWTRDPSADNALAEAIKKGNRMIVEGESARGTKTKDTYNLKGATKAHEAIGQKCGA